MAEQKRGQLNLCNLYSVRTSRGALTRKFGQSHGGLRSVAGDLSQPP